MSEEVKNVEEVVEETAESKDEKNAEVSVSKSKQKREARKVEAKAAKRKAAIGRIVEWVIGLAIAGLFIAAIVMGIYTSATVIKPGTDYSGCLTADGFIKGEDLSSVTDIGLEKLSIPSNKAYSDDATIQSDIDSILSQHEELVTDASLEAKMDDKVNIDYVGSIDGVEFEGGNSNGNGANLVLGSKSFIDTFEDQLVGSHPGDNVTVNVTFPEEYSQNPDLAGKPAVFEVVVNGIYVKPELTDDFVKEFCSDKGSTVDELRQYYVDKHYDENIQEYITSYIVDKAEASKVPSAYVKNAATLIYTTDQQMYEYTNSYYSQMLGGPLYSDFNAYTGLSDKEYQKELKNRAKATACETMTYEALYKKMGLSYTEEDYNEVLSTYGNNAVETYGEPFLKQTAMKLAVMNYVKANVVIE